MLRLVKLVLLSSFIRNGLSLDDLLTVGDLPADIRDEFIQIAVNGLLNIGNNCSAEPNLGQVNLLLYNRANPVNPITLDPANPYQIDPNKKLKILIHGWLGSSQTYGFPGLKNAYLTRYDCNVVIVEWSELAWQLYTTCYCDIPGIGEWIAKFLCHFSSQTGAPLSDVHLIGHSFGAQIFGFTGTYTKGICSQQIGRITALDPAGPIYEFDRPADRLDPSDSIFVDAIQTNEGFFGFYGGCSGDANFHVNCGTYKPGCPIPSQITNIPDVLIVNVAASHFRSLDIMIESVNSDQFKAKSCNNCPVLPLVCLTDVLNPSFIIMGEDCPHNPPKTNYYIPTNANASYAEGCTPYPLQGCT